MFHRRVATPATAFVHLFVGKHGFIVRAPVHRGRFFVNQTFFVKLGKKPLFPFIVIRFAGGDFAIPVKPEAQKLKLFLHIGNVFVSPLRRCGFIFDRRAFRRQPERIPAEWLQHVFTEHTLIARNYVTDGVVTNVSHMQATGRIREHGKTVVFFFGFVFDGLKNVIFSPVLLNFWFNHIGTILFLHKITLILPAFRHVFNISNTACF